MSLYKLSYVSKRLNISPLRISEILSEKGYKIQLSRNYKLSKEHIDILTEELAVDFYKKSKNRTKPSVISIDKEFIIDIPFDKFDIIKNSLYSQILDFEYFSGIIDDKIRRDEFNCTKVKQFMKRLIRSIKIKYSKHFFDIKGHIITILPLFRFYNYRGEAEENSEILLRYKLRYC